jgi:hypothetical protein
LGSACSVAADHDRRVVPNHPELGGWLLWLTLGWTQYLHTGARQCCTYHNNVRPPVGDCLLDGHEESESHVSLPGPSGK